MFTLLTNRKMHPALASRIEASLRGDRAAFTGGGGGFGGGQKLAPRTASLLQFGISGLVLALLCGITFLRHQAQREFERERRAFLEKVHAAAAPLTEQDLGYLGRTEAWTTALGARYEGDLVDPKLASPGALDAALHRPLVYVRLPLEAVSSPLLRPPAVAESRKDALLFCLLDPPSGKSEGALLSKVRMVRSKSPTLEERTPWAHRLSLAERGLPFLSPAWASKAGAATSEDDLVPLEREFEVAPLEEAKESARAEYFLAVIDEPGDEDGPEPDDERAHPVAHYVRVGLFEAGAATPVLRLRRRMDAGGSAPGHRGEFATGFDSCLLALEVRASALR